MKYSIWAEGYIATGEHGTAFELTDRNPIEANSFDDAIEELIQRKPENTHYYSKYTRANFTSEEDYNNRRSNWSFWGCALFDNESDARKSFG